MGGSCGGKLCTEALAALFAAGFGICLVPSPFVLGIRGPPRFLVSAQSAITAVQLSEVMLMLPIPCSIRNDPLLGGSGFTRCQQEIPTGSHWILQASKSEHVSRCCVGWFNEEEVDVGMPPDVVTKGRCRPCECPPCAKRATPIHSRISNNLRRIPLASVFSRDIKSCLYRHLATSTTRYAASNSPRNIRKTLVKLVVLDNLSEKFGLKSAVSLLSANSFCARADTLLPVLNSLSEELGTESAVKLLSTDSFCACAETLLPILDSLSKKVGMEAAVKLLSSGSFCARIETLLPILECLSKTVGTKAAAALLSKNSFCARSETLMPVLNNLSEKIGTKSAVALLSTGSFCARAESLLPALDHLSDKLGKVSAVRLLSWNGFCVRVDELMAKYPEIQAVLGEKGAVRVLSNAYLASMDALQWRELLAFIRNVQPGDTLSYLGSNEMMSNCKKVGWGNCAELYRNASQEERTRAGFLRLVDEYAREAL
ncbi:hypothetical protein BJ741DRAFT_675800 [Chytriomyces cf. hyalinus JEL632]|nr:hypothetical protein BJ741DRAFT_675800 [Chytriomyces cf. hyalinus JEL632]